MSYLRPIRLTELGEWLEANTDMGMVEAETLAQKMIDRYDILTYAKDPV